MIQAEWDGGCGETPPTPPPWGGSRRASPTGPGFRFRAEHRTSPITTVATMYGGLRSVTHPGKTVAACASAFPRDPG